MTTTMKTLQVIGFTASDKPICITKTWAEHSKLYQCFTPTEHNEAARVHLELADKATGTKAEKDHTKCFKFHSMSFDDKFSLKVRI